MMETDVDGDGVDEIDRLIAQSLAEEARLTMAELGRRVGLSRTAALARVRRLEDAGVITGYHAAVRFPEDPGRHVARVGIQTDTRDTGRYVRRLATLEGFREAETTAGAFDLLVRFETPTAAALDATLDEVKSWPTTTRTTTFVVLRRYGARG